MQGEKEGKKRREMIRLCVASDCDMHLPCVVFECLAFFLSIPFNCFLEMSDMQMYIDDSLSYNCSCRLGTVIVDIPDINYMSRLYGLLSYKTS